MDIFYYWQRLEQNLKNSEVGYFGSNNTKIVQLAERLPKRIWVVAADASLTRMPTLGWTTMANGESLLLKRFSTRQAWSVCYRHAGRYRVGVDTRRSTSKRERV